MGPARGAKGPGAAQGMGPNRDLHLAGKGAIQYPADVAGQVLADMAFQQFPKPSGWERDFAQRAKSANNRSPAQSTGSKKCSLTRNAVEYECLST